MKTYYTQPFVQSLTKEVASEPQISSVSIEAKEPSHELVKIYESLKQNFKARNFSLFGQDKNAAGHKKKSLSRRKLDRLKLPQLPRLPRVKHGQSKSPKKTNKQEEQESLGKTLRRQSSFINKIFRSNSKKRTKSDFVNRSSNKILPPNPNDHVMRMTINMPSRKPSMRNIREPVEVITERVITERVRDLYTARQYKQLTAKQIMLELQPLEEREFLSMMRAYNYLKVGPNVQGSYRAYLRPGNNSELIKRCLKARGCWVILESQDEGVNFLWSQIRATHFTKRLEARTVAPIEEVLPTRQLVLNYEKIMDQFTTTRLHEYPLLTVNQAILEKEVFRPYLNKVMGIACRGITKASEYYRIADVMDRRRPKYQPLQIANPHTIRLHNHVENASSIGNKKALLFYMRRYYEQQGLDPFNYLPQSVHLTGDVSRFSQDSLKDLLPFGLPCILKPGQFTNRGNGISVHTDWKSLQQAVNANRGGSMVIQKYLSPFLYKGRKFDIRVWVLWNGRQAWWYRQGYIRTASKEYSLANTSRFVHLTNDAVQKYSDTYGKHEQGNKISFNEFQKWLDFHQPGLNFWQTVYPEMKSLARDVFRVASVLMDQNKRSFGYELFGLDFLVDDRFKVWLIEANTNPCLQTSCTLLTRLVTNMVDNVISIAVDPLFPPPENRHRNFSFESNFKFELLFDGYTDNGETSMVGEQKFQGQSDCSDSGDESMPDG